MKERGLRVNTKPIDDSAESFKREYLCKWLEPSKEYHEAYKLWLWYILFIPFLLLRAEYLSEQGTEPGLPLFSLLQSSQVRAYTP